MTYPFWYGEIVLPAGYALAVAAILLVDVVRSPRADRNVARWPAAAFLAASGAYIFFSRRPVLAYDLPINPDEAMMAANAMRFRHGWLNWDILDGITSGPLNSAILAWPLVLGGDITLYATRLTGLACVAGGVVFLFLAARRLAGTRGAILATTPAVIFLASTTSHNFVHYSSEHLPVLLLAISLFLFVRSFESERRVPLLLAAAALGFVPFAKLQAAPIAAAVGLFVLARCVATASSRKDAVIRVALIVCAALAASLIYLLPLALSGGLDDAFKSYVTQPHFRSTPGWIDKIPDMLTHEQFFAALLACSILAVAAALVVWLFERRQAGRRMSPSPAVRWTALLAAFLAPVTYVSIAYSGRDFYHYLLLALPMLMLASAVAFARLAASPRKTAIQLAAFACSLAVMLPAAKAEWLWGIASFHRNLGAFQQGRMLETPRTLAWLRPQPRAGLLCWGWHPACYVDAGMTPATRETTNENQHIGTPLRDYFQARFLRDFTASAPDVIVDTVAPGSFGFTNPAVEGLQTFPPLADIAARDFSLLSRVADKDKCPRTYLRKTRLDALARSLVPFAAITASAEVENHPASAIDDRSVFETCDDNWLLPPGTLGSVTATFDAPAATKSVAILDTRRGPKGEWVGTYRVRLLIALNGTIVKTDEFGLRPFPYWTFHTLDRAVQADSVTVEVLQFRGFAGGLNELKVYRD